MEKDTNGRPTRFDKGDVIFTLGGAYRLSGLSAETLNKAFKGKLNLATAKVRLRSHTAKISFIATIPVRQVLVDTKAIDAP